MKILVMGMLVVMLSCSGVMGMPDKNEQFIQGKWSLSGTIGDDDRQMSWLLEWEFDNGRFVQSGYPPLLQKGRYRILSSQKELLTLELFDQEGTFGEKNRKLKIIIDRESKSLSIAGKKGFKREIKEKSKSENLN